MTMAHEILTPEEFARRLKIGRSTLFDWMNKGILVPGKHYFKVGRILRFVWSDEVVASLLESLSMSPKSGQVSSKKSRPATAKDSINWDY